MENEWFKTQTEFTPEQIAQWVKMQTNGVKPSKNGMAIKSHASISSGYQWREFDDAETAELAGFAELTRDFFTPFIESVAERRGDTLPSFLPQDTRKFMRYAAQPHCALLYKLVDLGALTAPKGDDVARMCAMVWG
jgi:hypothetical protein